MVAGLIRASRPTAQMRKLIWVNWMKFAKKKKKKKEKKLKNSPLYKVYKAKYSIYLNGHARSGNFRWQWYLITTVFTLNIRTPYRTCSRSINQSSWLPFDMSKIAGWEWQTVYRDHTPRSAAYDHGLHCLFRLVWPNTKSYYQYWVTPSSYHTCSKSVNKFYLTNCWCILTLVMMNKLKSHPF